MNVLIACEFSGIVRDAFIAKEHNAISCDLLDTEAPGPHIKGNVIPLLTKYRWDLVIAHPPCQYLANSGVRWLNGNRDRLRAMMLASDFFQLCYRAKAERVCIENPIQHKYAKEAHGCGNQTQTIQPWQYGHGETKAICLWLRNLPPLKPTNIVEGRTPRVHHASPGPNRWKERSRFYTGIAEAMAEQWSNNE